MNRMPYNLFSLSAELKIEKSMIMINSMHRSVQFEGLVALRNLISIDHDRKLSSNVFLTL